MSVNDILDFPSSRWSNGGTFYSFIEECLLSQLMPFDGSNPCDNG